MTTAQRRLLAGGLDLGCLLLWALAVAALLATLRASGWLPWGPLALNLLGLALVVVPATLAAALLEAGRYEATPGKLSFGLRVRGETTGDRAGAGRAGLRNLLKLGLPLTLAHLAVLGVPGGAEAWLGAAVALGLPLLQLGSLLGRGGRTWYDRLAGTTVIPTSPGRRFSLPEPEEVGPPAPSPAADAAAASSQT